MSIFQFLMKSGFCFYNRDREVIFDLLTNDKKVSVQNGITITENNDIIITSWVGVRKSFLSSQKLMTIANYMNEFSGMFSCYIEDTEEDCVYFNLKTLLHLLPGTMIDENFWKTQMSIQINSISIITNFLFFVYPKTEFNKTKDVESVEFKNFFLKEIKSYVESLRILQEEEGKRKKERKKNNYNLWTKEQINQEIDFELDKYKKGKSDIAKLNSLVRALKKKEG